MKWRLASVSPLIFAAAFTLLAFIIGIFAMSNYSREKELMTDALLQKGLSVMRFLDTGVRVSMRANWQSRRNTETDWSDTVQGVIDQLHDDTDVHFIEVADSEGIVIAASDPARVGKRLHSETRKFLKSSKRDKPATRVNMAETGEAAGFQVGRVFKPRVRATMLHSKQHRQGMMEQMRGKQPALERLQKDFDRLESEKMSVLVQLEMAQYNSAVKSQLWQIVTLSVVLLLVGAGGWLSLMTLQGFRGTESRLRRIRAFNDMLVESLPVGLVATDPEGVVQLVNSVAEKTIGKKADAMIGMQPDEILPAGLSRPLADAQQQEGSPLLTECELVHDNGQVTSLFLTTVSVSDEEKNFTGNVLLIQDVSNLRRLETELRRSERLAALGRMAAGVAHELRNPLSSIKGLAVLLKNKVVHDPQGVETSDVLVAEVERLNRSIGELLDYARPETLQLADVSLQGILDKASALVSIDANALGIKVGKKYDTQSDQVRVDEDRMNQVFLNLLLNGIQAIQTVTGEGEGGGVITLKTYRSEGWICATVEDTGCGVIEEHLPRMFDPYFTTKSNGTGLGLALSAKIVEEHGGNISVKSKEGVGTSVIVKLPANKV